MIDVALIATILVFFVAMALLVRACSRITDQAAEEGEPEDLVVDSEGRRQA